MKKVLFVVGSLRQGSFNHQFAQAAEQVIAGQAEVSYLDYGQVPVFNQELELPVLPEVAAVRQAVLEADAIWLFSPVYNFGIPGPVKNLLDWLSRAIDLSDPAGPSALNGKLVTVSAVAAGGQDQVFEAYQALLPFIRTQAVGEFTASGINDSAWVDGQLVLTDEVKEKLAKQAADLLAAIQ